jgi:hypothetical protein
MSAFGQSALHYLVALWATTISDVVSHSHAGVDGLPKDLEIVRTQWTCERSPVARLAPVVDQSDVAHDVLESRVAAQAGFERPPETFEIGLVRFDDGAAQGGERQILVAKVVRIQKNPGHGPGILIRGIVERFPQHETRGLGCVQGPCQRPVEWPQRADGLELDLHGGWIGVVA